MTSRVFIGRCNSLVPVLLFGLLYGCEESLPPRNDPPEILRASIGLSGTVVVVVSQEVLSGGNIIVRVQNIHDEVLSGEARIAGEVTISAKGNPSISRTLALGPGDLLNPSVLVGNTLTIPPKQSVDLMQPWDQRTSTGGHFWDGLPVTTKFMPNGDPFLETDTLRAIISVQIQVFNRVQPLRPVPLEVGVVYHLRNHPNPT